jgi:DNA transformation protein
MQRPSVERPAADEHRRGQPGEEGGAARRMSTPGWTRPAAGGQYRSMPEAAADLAFAEDLFGGLGQVQARRMFGGAGLYAGGVMFALVDEGRIYLKTDQALQADLEAAGADAWIYTDARGPKAGVAQQTSYWSLPESALDDPEEACAWARRALAVAAAKKAATPRRRRR